VLELLEKNYRVHASLNSLEIHEDFHIKHHVLAILQESGKADNRPKNMEVDAFLSLLEAFNSGSVHFT